MQGSKVAVLSARLSGAALFSVGEIICLSAPFEFGLVIDDLDIHECVKYVLEKVLFLSVLFHIFSYLELSIKDLRSTYLIEMSWRICGSARCFEAAYWIVQCIRRAANERITGEIGWTKHKSCSATFRVHRTHGWYLRCTYDVRHMPPLRFCTAIVFRAFALSATFAAAR